jgi:hypothetical protein
MLKMLIAAVAAIAPGAGTNAAEVEQNSAECIPQGNAPGCSIQWDFSRSPRAHFQVEYLDENSLQWRATGRAYDALRTRSEPVQPARLYRVRGCDDAAVKRNCTWSTVQWAIARPATEDIPDYLVDGNGVEMHIAKNAPENVRLAQYNVYRLVQLLDRVPDPSSLPPMTRPRIADTSADGMSDDEEILLGVYENYTERRAQAQRSERRVR